VHFSKTDAGAASGVPADYTFTAGDNGVHAFTNGVTLVSAGTQTLTARDTANNSVTGNASVLVNAAATIQFGVSAPALVIGGSAFTFTVSALDAYSNITPAYAGTVHFTSSDGQASLPGNATLANGNGTFQATLATHGNQALLATDAGNVSITGSTSIAVAVKSYTAPSATGTGPITASFTGGGAACSFSQAQFLPPPPGTGLVPPSSPAGNYNFPHGLFVFKTTGCTPGSTIVVTIIYPTAASGLYSYWNYGPEPQIPGDHWYIMQAAINGNVVIFPITDGSRGDDDLQPNGDIVDQGGLAYFAPMIVPALSPWLLAVLALMLAVFTGQVTRRAVVVGKDESAR
jgi:hypothetical protein